MTSRREFLVYLSSTVADLEDERTLAQQVIGDHGRIKTSYRASEEGVVATCIKDVRECDLYVAILGQRYGHVPGIENPEQKSITELEYEACRQPGNGRPPIPRLIFIKPTDHVPGIAQAHIDALSNPATADRMKAFLQRANGPTEVAFEFRSSGDLRAELKVRMSAKAAEFHAQHAQPTGILGGERIWKNRLAPVAIAYVPGTDSAFHAKYAAGGGEKFTALELSPDAADYIFEADRGFSRAQLGCLLLTTASLNRFFTGVGVDKVEALIDFQRAATGRFVLLCVGIAAANLPQAWNRASVMEIDAATWAGPSELLFSKIFAGIQTLAPELSAAARLALPYLILAPTDAEAAAIDATGGAGFAGFEDDDERKLRGEQFKAIKAAASKLNATWPAGVYGTEPEAWRCFGPASVTARELVATAVQRINAAPAGARERRFLQGAILVPRCYRLSDFVTDRFGSRRAIEALRDRGGLILVDELALLEPALRKTAKILLSGTRSAIASISPCDPAHLPFSKLLGDLSFLTVGTLVSRFTVDQDPRCELALNSVARVERWLKLAIPELMLAADEQEVNQKLAASMHTLLV